MKRFLICALALGLLAGPAMAQNPAVTVWLQAPDGSNKVTVGVSQTAVIQLWASLAGGQADRPIVNISTILKGYNAAFGKTLSFEIQGFNDITIPNSQMQRGGRGPNIDAGALPAHMDEYSFFAEDPTALNGTDGVVGTDRAFLMDEIIIHGLTQNVDPTGTKNSDLVLFANAPQEPIAFGMAFSPFPPPGAWSITQLASVAATTGNFSSPEGPFLVNVTPEPATLGLIALGGLAVIRRRR